MDIADARPGLPEPLRGLINAMVHPQAEKRPATSTEVVKALRALQPEGDKRQKRTTRPAPETVVSQPTDQQPTKVAAPPLEVAITGKDVMHPQSLPRKPAQVPLKPVYQRKTWGTGQVVAAVIIILGLLALGDYVYIKYLDGLSWNQIMRGEFLPSRQKAPPPPPAVDASTGDVLEEDEPAEEAKPVKKKRPGRPRKKKPAQPPAAEP